MLLPACEYGSASTVSTSRGCLRRARSEERRVRQAAAPVSGEIRDEQCNTHPATAHFNPRLVDSAASQSATAIAMASNP